MLENLKLVVFDYPKYLPKTDTNRRILSDLLHTKQDSYNLADERFVSISGLDFIGTHLMIYDVKDTFNPKLVLSIRNLTEDRTKYHNLRMPTEDYLPKLCPEAQEALKKFKADKPVFCESGALYLDQDYSFKKTGLPLVEISTLMVANHLVKNDIFHFAAATNVTFKSTRWVAPMGECKKMFLFDHPYIRHQHELILMNGFNYNWFAGMYEKYFQLWKKRIEIRPDSNVVKPYILDDNALEQFVLNQVQLARAG